MLDWPQKTSIRIKIKTLWFKSLTSNDIPYYMLITYGNKHITMSFTDKLKDGWENEHR